MKILEILGEARETDVPLGMFAGVNVFIGSPNGIDYHWWDRLLERHPDRVNDKEWQRDYIEGLAIAASKHPYKNGDPLYEKVFITLGGTGSICEWKAKYRQLILLTIFGDDFSLVRSSYQKWTAQFKYKPPVASEVVPVPPNKKA